MYSPKLQAAVDAVAPAPLVFTAEQIIEAARQVAEQESPFSVMTEFVYEYTLNDNILTVVQRKVAPGWDDEDPPNITDEWGFVFEVSQLGAHWQLSVEDTELVATPWLKYDWDSGVLGYQRHTVYARKILSVLGVAEIRMPLPDAIVVIDIGIFASESDWSSSDSSRQSDGSDIFYGFRSEAREWLLAFADKNFPAE